MSRTSRRSEEENFNIRIPADLKAAFEAASEAAERPAAQLIRDFMQAYVEEHERPEQDYDAWFRAAVQAAIDETGPGIPHEQAMSEMKARIDARIDAAAKRAG